MAGRRKTPKKPRRVAALTHGGAKRRNAPTAEAQPFMADEDRVPVRVALARRNRDLDPQLWRGKDEQDAAAGRPGRAAVHPGRRSTPRR